MPQYKSLVEAAAAAASSGTRMRQQGIALLIPTRYLFPILFFQATALLGIFYFWLWWILSNSECSSYEHDGASLAHKQRLNALDRIDSLFMP